MNVERQREIILNACLNRKLLFLINAFKDGDIDRNLLINTIANGRTPLFLAASVGNLELVKFFVQERLVDDMKIESNIDDGGDNDDGDEMNPLHIACYNNHLKVCRMLHKEFGYSLRKTASGGYLPIHLACMGGHRDVVLWIRDVCGASILEARTRIGVTPMDIATAFSHLELARTLRFFGSNDESFFPPMYAVSDHETQKEMLAGKKFLVHAMLKK